MTWRWRRRPGSTRLPSPTAPIRSRACGPAARSAASPTSGLCRNGWLAMADERVICPSGALADSGKGVRFDVEYFGQSAPAFVVRYSGAVHGYLNRCAHVAMELDWQEGVFFDLTGHDLLCSTHGASYDPRSGRCLGGPCNGTPLLKLKVEERGGMIYFTGYQDE